MFCVYIYMTTLPMVSYCFWYFLWFLLYLDLTNFPNYTFNRLIDFSYLFLWNICCKPTCPKGIQRLINWWDDNAIIILTCKYTYCKLSDQVKPISWWCDFVSIQPHNIAYSFIKVNNSRVVLKVINKHCIFYIYLQMYDIY